MMPLGLIWHGMIRFPCIAALLCPNCVRHNRNRPLANAGWTRRRRQKTRKEFANNCIFVIFLLLISFLCFSFLRLSVFSIVNPSSPLYISLWLLLLLSYIFRTSYIITQFWSPQDLATACFRQSANFSQPQSSASANAIEISARRLSDDYTLARGGTTDIVDTLRLVRPIGVSSSS